MLSAHPRRTFLNRVVLAAGSAALARHLVTPDLGAGVPGTAPVFNRIAGTRFRMGGRVDEFLSAITAQWLRAAPASNPAMLEMFRDRDRRPLRDLVPWAGEFAGKYLVSAVQVWRLTGDEALRSDIAAFVKQLIELQAEDGYLGPWPKESRLTGHAPNVGGKNGETWDAWGHYHVMLGLLLWSEDAHDGAAFSCARRIGDLFCARFSKERLVDTGSTEMNLAPIHGLALLHTRTKDPRHLQMALKICEEFSAKTADGKPLAGDYLNAALAGKEFYQMPKPRWESLHPIMGLAELYRSTGDDKFRRAFEQIWWSIVKLDRHNNGGFSSGEQAQGNPYHRGAIETCCTIAWIALSVEMLRLTGDPVVADELELSTLNSVLGLHSPNGRWVSYNTPMDGVRKASAHDIVFQARAGSPELNCCSVNGARGFGLISDWAMMGSADAVVLNWFGPSTIVTRLPSGIDLTLTQETEYPCNSHVLLKVAPSRTSRFVLKLRIPTWSRTTSVMLNKKKVAGAAPGTYLAIDRAWKPGDLIRIEFDFSFRYWRGERECAGRSSVYRGPLLLTYDRRFNEMDPDQVPALDAAELRAARVQHSGWLPPMLLLEMNAADGRKVRLCDFGSAGVGGSPYRSWLEINHVPNTEFSRENPLRAGSV